MVLVSYYLHTLFQPNTAYLFKFYENKMILKNETAKKNLTS